MAGVDTQFKKFLSTVDTSKDIMSQYQTYLETTGSTLSKLGTTLKNVAANMGIMLAASLAIKGIAYLWDKANVTLEEQQKIVDDLSSEITTLREEEQKLLGLQAQGGITEAEESRLKYLQRRLELDEKIYKIEQKKLADSELTGKGDILLGGILGTDLSTLLTGGNSKEFDKKLEYSEVFTDATKAVEKYKNALSEIDKFDINNKNHIPSVENYKKLADEQVKNLDTYKSSMLQLQKEYLDNADIIKGYLDSGAYDDSPEEKKYFEQKYQEYVDFANQIENDIIKINLEIDTVDVSSIKKNISDFFENKGALGVVDQNYLDSLSTEELRTVDLGIEQGTITSWTELTTAIDDYRKSIEEANKVEPNAPLFKDTISSVSEKVSELDSLSAILEDVKNKGTFNFDALGDGNFVEKFGKYEAEYKNFVDTITSSPNDIKACQDAFDSMATAWLKGSGILNGLSNETAEYTKKLLEEHGIKNAGEIVESQLNILNSLSNDTFKNTFKDMGETYQNFVDTIKNSPNDIEACSSSYYSLVKEWTDSTGVLNDLTEANRQEKIALLEQNGVANASSFVNAQLAQVYIQQANEAISAGQSTEVYKEKIKNLGMSAQDTQLSLYSLQLAEIAANQQKLDFSEQIAECNRLAQAAGLASAMLNAAQSQRSIAQQLQAEGISYAEGLTSGRVAQIQEELIGNHVKDMQDRIAKKISTSVDVKGYSGGAASSGGGGGGSKVDPYKAEIDALKKYTDAYEEAKAKREAIDKKYDNAKTNEERLELAYERIKAMEEEQKAIEALNEARDKEIAKNVEKLRNQKFDVTYDPYSDKLQINNLEHLNELKGKDQEKTNELIKEYENIIKSTEDMAKANRDLVVTWQDNVYTLDKYREEIQKLKEEIYDDKLEDFDFKLDVADSLDNASQQIEIIGLKVKTTIEELNEAYASGLDNTSDYVQKLIKNLMDFAEKLRDIKKEELEDKKDDYDSAKNAVVNRIDDNIKALNEQKKALQDINDEQDRALQLSKLKENLSKAKENKVIHVYRKGKG